MSNPQAAPPRASERQLDRAAAQLTDLGARHGLSGFRHAGEGRLVADITPGRTYFDIARFELEAETMLGAAVDIIPAQTPSAAVLAGRPLTAPRA